MESQNLLIYLFRNRQPMNVDEKKVFVLFFIRQIAFYSKFPIKNEYEN